MKRPYFFELLTIVNFVLIQLFLWRITRAPLATLPRTLAMMVPAFLLQAAIGVLIRVGYLRVAQALLPVPAQTGVSVLHEYLAAVRSPSWLFDTLRISAFTALSVHTYGWIKLSLPLLHPRLFDQELWNIDRAMLFGHSPNILFLDLFSNPSALRFFDWTYANVFVASLTLASIFFVSLPDRRLRIAFTDSNTLMWIAGAWLYLLIPSLGPAYRFPEVWLPLQSMLSNTQQLQRILMTNYQAVLGFARGLNRPVNILLGIGAFPSLHVAFEILVTLWLRRVWKAGAVVFAIFSVIIFVGSVVTGWHYLIDSIAGVVLAVLCYAAIAIRERREALSLACLS
jgi:hypothetical protein